MTNNSYSRPESGRFFSSLKRRVDFQLVIIFLFIVLLAGVSSFYMAKRQALTASQRALESVEAHFDSIRHDLTYLLQTDNAALSCADILTELRRNVFHSDTIKEIGLFDGQGRMYCASNSSAVSFRLYKTILERLAEHSLTLSYTQTKFSKEKSVMLLFTGPAQTGASIVIPPRYIIDIVRSAIKSDVLNFDIKVISRSLIEEGDKTALESFQQKSAVYPLEIEVKTDADYYLDYFLAHFWKAIVLASLLSAWFLYRRQSEVSTYSLEHSLEQAIENDYFQLNYQPIVEADSGKCIGCEALLRWNDPIRGSISPAIFIPLAEKVGIIEQLTHLVIVKTCQFMQQHDELLNSRYISVNISRSVILKQSFMDKLLAYLESVPQCLPQLVFEITEDNNFSREELVVLKRNLTTLSSYGIKVAVDDFGTGYSGLNFIRQYPFSVVKIDKVFIKSLYDDSNVIPLLESMLTIANNLGMSVIVEGVEEESQLKILRSIGFQYIQGFYFSRPLAENDTVSYLTENKGVVIEISENLPLFQE